MLTSAETILARHYLPDPYVEFAVDGLLGCSRVMLAKSASCDHTFIEISTGCAALAPTPCQRRTLHSIILTFLYSSLGVQLPQELVEELERREREEENEGWADYTSDPTALVAQREHEKTCR